MEDMGLPLPSPFNYHLDSGYFSGVAYGNFETGQDTSSVIKRTHHPEREKIEIQSQEQSEELGREISATGKVTLCTYSMPSDPQCYDGESSNPSKRKQTRSASISSDSHFEATKLSNPVCQKEKDSTSIEDTSVSIPRRTTRTWSLEVLPPKERRMSTWKPAQEVLGDEPDHSPTDRKGKAKYDERNADNPPERTQLPISPGELLTPEEREFIKSSEMNGERSLHKELLDFDEFARLRMYNYYVSRLDSARIICDGTQEMADSFAQMPEDLSLLKTMTRHHSSRRWWSILINNLACEECVALLRHKKEKPKVKSLQ